MRRVTAAALVLTACAATAHAGCLERVVDLRGPKGMIRFEVEIADTPEARARGLMERTDLDEGEGMLFLFDPPREVAFWMKNTPLPLDIIYIDARGVVLNVAERTTPYSETPLPSEGVARAVLEVNAGLSERFGIGPGTEIRHPRLAPETAAWPCP